MEHDPFVDDVLGGSPHLVSRLYPCVITGLSRVSSLITGVIIHLLTGMSHQVGIIKIITDLITSY